MTRALVRWVGGKTRLAEPLLSLLTPEERARRYVDPFVGGGALLATLRGPDGDGRNAPAVVSDLCAPLTCTYVAVRDRPDRLLDELHYQEGMRGKSDAAFRRWFEGHKRVLSSGVVDTGRGRRRAEGLDVAVSFLCVSRSAFNGLWRVNADGRQNSAIDLDKREVVLSDEEHYQAWSALLRDVAVHREDFRLALPRAGEGDLVFADSPYVPSVKSSPGPALFAPRASSYDAWNARRWSARDTADLWSLLASARDRGAVVLHTNHDAPEVRAYAERVGFEVHPLRVDRSVSRDADTRGKIGEVALLGRPR